MPYYYYTTSTSTTASTKIMWDKQHPLYNPNQFVRFISPTSRVIRVGHVNNFTAYAAWIEFVGKKLDGGYVKRRMKVPHCDVFKNVGEEDYKMYAIDLLKL